MSYLHTKFHDNWISSFRGVAMTRFWDGRTDGRTDGVTALLDLLSPLATQVKIVIIDPPEKRLNGSHYQNGKFAASDSNYIDECVARASICIWTSPVNIHS